MKKKFSIAALSFVSMLGFAQVDYSAKAVTSYSATENTTTSNTKFNSWGISAGAGVPLVQAADLTSIKNGNGKNLLGYSAYFSIDKAITHAFGLKLQYDRGETRQGDFDTRDKHPGGGNYIVGARTQYDALSLLGDVNFSSLLRRVDNKSPYRWALHGYAGIGTLAYRAYQKDMTSQRLMTEIKPFSLHSLFGQAGAGLKYKVSNSLDLEARLMYVMTGDDEFDGGGRQYSAINSREDQISDNMFNAQLGMTFKLGPNETHLMWHDPMQEIYYNLNVLENKTTDVEVCSKGDLDNDGVCDDWDRELNTPAGARVDGAGVALDADLDGVIDLYDKCVTVQGPVENQGCPNTDTAPTQVVGGTTRNLEGIEFDFDSDRILSSNTPILNNAVNYIKSSSDSYNVFGSTDAKGSDSYNQNLSQRRADNVKKYLISNGVESNRLNSIGLGESKLRYPECQPAENCPEWKNRANRRVYFEVK